MSRTRIKICGVLDEAMAAVAAEAGADAIGLIFVRSSPRFVEVNQARAIAGSLPPFVAAVGVFVDAPPEDVQRVRRATGLTAAQLHGDETRADAEACGPRVVKAVRFDATPESEERLRTWAAAPGIDAVLVDGSRGGEGKAVDWTALSRVASALSLPLVLAGGLTPDNVGEAIRTVRPYAVDVTSGVEARRGEKDPGLIRAFCQAVRQTDGER